MARHEAVLVSRTLYQIGVVTLIAAIMWVGVGIYLAITKPLPLEVDKVLLEPITTSIDLKVVEELGTRVKIEASLAEISQVTTVATESASQDDTIETGQTNELIN